METSHRPVRSGALTLLFTVVLLCLAVLAVLSLATARADEALAKKSLDRLAQEAAAERTGQEWLAALDAADPGTLPADTVSTGDGGVQAELTLESGDTLRLAAEPAGEGWRITRWQLTAPWEPDTSLDVWTGQ